jgi:hypothetical protein
MSIRPHFACFCDVPGRCTLKTLPPLTGAFNTCLAARLCASTCSAVAGGPADIGQPLGHPLHFVTAQALVAGQLEAVVRQVAADRAERLVEPGGEKLAETLHREGLVF